MEALGRVELPTNGLGNRCSIHLSYRAIRRNPIISVSLLRRDSDSLGCLVSRLVSDCVFSRMFFSSFAIALRTSSAAVLM